MGDHPPVSPQTAPMRTTIALIVGFALGIAGTLAVQRFAQQPGYTATARLAVPIELSSTKIICDREHTAFDAEGHTYCQEVPRSGLKGVYTDQRKVP
jgi:hypothetical protein